MRPLHEVDDSVVRRSIHYSGASWSVNEFKIIVISTALSVQYQQIKLQSSAFLAFLGDSHLKGPVMRKTPPSHDDNESVYES